MADSGDLEIFDRRPDGRLGWRPDDHEQGEVLRGVFQQLPVPAFLLDCGGVIHRVNPAAADLLTTTTTCVVGRPFSLFLDMSHRAAFRSHLSALARDGAVTSFDIRLAGRPRAVDSRLHLSLLDPATRPDPLILAVLTPSGDAGRSDTAAGRSSADELPQDHRAEDDKVLVAAARRLDLLARTTRLLLHQDCLNEPVALGRATRLLQGEFADWALIDLVREGTVHRAVIAGPENVEGRVGTALLGKLDPTASRIPGDVVETGASLLYPLVADDTTNTGGGSEGLGGGKNTAGGSEGPGGGFHEDGNQDVLGRTADGRPVVVALRAGSVLCVPLRDDTGVLGTLTLVRHRGRIRFGPADLALLEEVGEHLGLAIRTERSYQRRSEVAHALQASLLPRSLPTVPGLDLGATYRGATEGVEVGGDFYDVFDSPGGCGVVLGDVCGKGEEAAALTGMVRYGVRLLGLSSDRPMDVLRQVNRAMVVQQDASRFATVVAAHLRWHEGKVVVRLASAGHPWPIVLRAEGGVHLVQGGGLPLGVFADAEPSGQEFELYPGDTVLLYSDGVTEARDPGGHLYGEQGLAGAVARGVGLTASAFVKAIETDLDQYTGGRIRDDMALLAVRIDAG